MTVFKTLPLCLQIGHMLEILPLVALLIGLFPAPWIPGDLVKCLATCTSQSPMSLSVH